MPSNELAKDSIEKIDQLHWTLSQTLDDIGHKAFPPEARKRFTRMFTTGDLEKLLGVPESSFRSSSIKSEGPQPERMANRRRVYSLEQVWELREFLAEKRPKDALRFLPHRREGEHTQIIAAVNFKGGSSKTTTSLHLSHYLALQGYRVLAVDLDPQASLTTTFGLFPDKDVSYADTIYSVITYNGEKRPIEEVIRKTYFTGLDLIPSNLIVQEFEFETPQALTSKVHDPYGYFYERLDNAFSEVSDRYDVIVIDTAPTLGYLTLSALFAATGLIITVHPAMMDIASCSQFLKMMSDTAKVLTDRGGKFDHDFIRFLLTRYDPNDHPQIKTASLMRTLFQDDVLMKEALESTAIAGAGIAKKSLYETESGEVGREPLRRALESMDAVNDEILKLIHQQWGR
ncbi:plasmid partitioning protein RepA [Roseibium sp. RKSG952]|nr:plasmid partitioning protein RepA [Roseibium sp. RKSG952]